MNESKLYRHGDRAPKRALPTVKYSDPSYWPMGFRELTPNGIQGQYELGQWLRERYSTFLSPFYKVNELYVRSTDEDRALMSAYATLAGLYPPQGFQLWNENIPWQPIPVHTIPRKIDDVIVQKRKCPKYDNLYKDTVNSDFFISENEKHADFYKNLSQWTGLTVKDFKDIEKIKSTLDSIKSYNPSYLPEWEKDLDWDLLNYLHGFVYRRFTSTLTMKRLSSGPFFNYIFEHMDGTISPVKPSSVRKMLIISGHGTTISLILNTMGVFDGYPPDSGATILWELRRRANGQYFVNIYLKSGNNVKELSIRGCDFKCSYEDFKNAMGNITLDIDSWEKECHGLTDTFY
ncbi:unnamed protein product [Acanthoscelides obtectus]|uniref:acid phosphatase n=1 Tax=Acanthoscelides obtectus TaxID=200917 RepID=A0A9P0KSK9_ACAOB|nr:unnamed protein product [Acanthoscelides obtectus]CAK1659039.1 Lysosomal acid phosphatase [Acanthoscelides obtectus]